MTPEQIQRTYAELAELYDGQGQLRQRDWFLVLAADAAQSAGNAAEADRLLGRLLGANPHHFLKPFGSFAEAVGSPDVESYVSNLRRTYPPAKAAELLQVEQGRRLPPLPSAEDGTLLPPPRTVPQSIPLRPQQEPEVLFARVRSDPQPPPEPDPPPPIPFKREPPPPPRPAPPPPPPKQRQPQRAPAPPRPPDPDPPFAPEPRHAAPRKRPRAESPAQAGSPVVPVGLFVLLLLLGLGLTVYTFLRPFLPAE